MVFLQHGCCIFAAICAMIHLPQDLDLVDLLRQQGALLR